MFTVSLITQSAGAFGTGVLASLSPCVYPIIPITVGFLGSQAKDGGQKRNVFLYVSGQTLALVVLGVAAVQLGETLGFSSEDRTFNILIGSFILIAGIAALYGRIPSFMSRWNLIGDKFLQRRGQGPLAAFLLGVGAALLASPCTSPILGGVLALIANSATLYQGIFLMFMYAVGFSLVFLVLGLGLLRMKYIPRAGKWMVWVHKTSAFALILGGVYYLYFASTL